MTSPCPVKPYYLLVDGVEFGVIGGDEDGPIGSLQHKYFIEACLMRGKLAAVPMEEALAKSAKRIIYKRG